MCICMGQKFQCTEFDYYAMQKGKIVAHQKFVQMGQEFRCTQCKYRKMQKGTSTAMTIKISPFDQFLTFFIFLLIFFG